MTTSSGFSRRSFSDDAGKAGIVGEWSMACETPDISLRALNWMQLDEYLESDDRIVLPVGSTEQHAYLSLETDNIIAERLAVEAAEPSAAACLVYQHFHQ
jgi:Creatinine amidohydrolase